MSTVWCCRPVFPLPTTASPTLQGALKNSFGEVVLACDMPKPCKFQSHDSCQKRFLWTHKEVHLAPHPVVSPVLQVEDTEKFPQAHSFESLDSSSRVSKQGLCFTALQEDGGFKRLVELEISCKADGVGPPDHV